MKKLFIIAAMAAIATTASAQKSEITKARAAFDLSTKTETYKEDGVEKQRTIMVPEKLEEAKALMAKAKEAWEAQKAKGKEVKPDVIAMGYDMKGDIYQRIMANELNHAVAKEPLDTMLFYTSLTECLDAYEECSKYDAKGQYTMKNKLNMIRFQPYYVYCGQFFSSNGQSELAAETFERWLNFTDKYSLTGGESDQSFDRNMIAYYAALSLYTAKKFEGMSKFEDMALAYDKESENVRQLYMVAAMEQGDTARWESLSRKFIFDGTAGEGTMQNLMAHYFATDQIDKVVSFAKEVEEKLPGNKMGPYAQGIVLMNQSKFQEAAEYFEKTLAIEPDFVDALYNAGVCWCNYGYSVNEELSGRKVTKAENDREIEKVRSFYRKAEPYFLKIQELLPDEPNRWARRLSTIYYILGDDAKQKEFEALSEQ